MTTAPPDAAPPEAPPIESHARLLKRVTRLAVTVAVGLVALKAAAWMVTSSVSIASSLVDSLMDTLASAVNLWAVHLSLKPADDEHRFGHGKAEALAGLAQAAFVVGSAVFLSFEAVDRLVNPVVVTQSEIGVGVMIISIVATLGLVLYQRSVARRTGSLAVEADSLHYTGDVLMNVAVIAGIVLSAEVGWTWADPAFAIIVAAVLIRSALLILRGAVDQLMDRELPDDVRARIIELALSEPLVLDAHDLKTRTSGRDAFVQLHLGMADELPLVEAHRAGVRVSAMIRAEIPNAEVIVHHDPAEEHDPPADGSALA